jgi:penicillin-binding protein-related factor A (putative recombinase)
VQVLSLSDSLQWDRRVVTTLNPGKKFEDDFKHSLPEGVFCHRLKTQTSGHRGVNEIADFLVFEKPHLFVFELKTTQEKRLPFMMIRANQLVGIKEAVQHKGVVGGFVIQFRDPYSHWFVPIHVVEEYIKKGAKSIPLADFEKREDIIEIQHRLKRVTCVLRLRELLDKIKEAPDANNH